MKNRHGLMWKVLKIQIDHDLGSRAVRVDVPALVDAYIEEFGAQDVSEVDGTAYEQMVCAHERGRSEEVM